MCPDSLHGVCMANSVGVKWCNIRCSVGTLALLHDPLCSAHLSHNGDSFSRSRVMIIVKVIGSCKRIDVDLSETLAKKQPRLYL